MDFTNAYIMAGAGSALAIFWLIIYFKYSKHFVEVYSAVDSKEFFLPELFFIGFGIIDLFHIDLSQPFFAKRKKKIAEVRGEKFSEFFLYVMTGAQITYGITLAPLGLFVGAMSNDLVMGGLGLSASVIMVVYLNSELMNSISRRHDILLRDFPQMASKLALLVSAGMIIRDAWKEVAYAGTTPLYLEMQTVCINLDNGESELVAMEDFANRCVIKEIRKFASVIIQNQQKGSAELTKSLMEQAAGSWEQKKRLVKVKGELASQKLLVPTTIMLFGILIMIVIPAFSSIV